MNNNPSQSKKYKIMKFLYLALYIICAFVIIVESCIPGNKSAEQSNAVGGIVTDIVDGVVKDQSKEIPLEKIEIVDKKDIQYVGDIVSLNVQMTPSDATNQSLLFESSDEKVATISNTGEVSFLNEGEVTIKVTSRILKNVVDTWTVRVENVIETDLIISSNATYDEKRKCYILYVGKSYPLSVEFVPSNTTNQSLKYSVVGNNISIDNKGVVHALSLSKDFIDTVTVQSLNVTKTISFIVRNEEEVALSSMKFSDEEITLYPHQTYFPSIHFNPTNATFKDCIFTSLDHDVVTVDPETGKIEAVCAGSTFVLATSTYYGIETRIRVIVRDYPCLEDFTLQGKEEMTISTSQTIEVKNIRPMNAYLNEIIWSSSDEKIATVTALGCVQAHKVGEVIICAKAKNITREIKIKVIDKTIDENVKGLDIENKLLEKDNVLFIEDGRQKIRDLFNISWIDGIKPIDDTIYCDIIQNNSIVQYDMDSEIITPLNEGQIEIYFYNNSLKNTYKFDITIKHKLYDFNFLINNKIVNDTYQIYVNDLFTLSIDKYNDNNNDYNYKWSIYDQRNLLTSLSNKEITLSLSKEGTYYFKLQIYTTLNKIEKEFSIEVVKTLAKELKLFYKDSLIDNETIHIMVGENIKVTPDVFPSDAIVSYSYTTDDFSILNVSQTGEIRGLKAGISNITITDTQSNISKTFNIQVHNVIALNEDNKYTLQSKSIKKTGNNSYTLINGSSATLILNFLSNASYKKVEFSSSNEKIAKIGQDGVIVPIKVGKTMIQARCSDNIENEIVVQIDLEIVKKPLINDFETFTGKLRKGLGHFGIFLLMGIFSTFVYFLFFKKKQWTVGIILNFAVGFLIAGISEFIQTKVPNRTGCWSDVILDFTGFSCSSVLITIVVVMMAIVSYKKKQSILK